MKFGLYLRNYKSFPEMLQYAQFAEELNYYGAYLNDHIHGFADDGKEPYLEAWTTMTGIGVKTKNIRIGHIVLFNSLRNPAVLAKMVSTLDNIINGRVEVLIGAGWNEPEYKGYDLMENGKGMPSADERVRRLRETIQILQLMFKQEETDFKGEFWKLDRALNIPQPIQKDLRIIVGAEKPRLIRIAVKYANGLNLPAFEGPNAVQEKMNTVNKAFDKYGKNANNFELSLFCGIPLLKNEEEVKKYVKNLSEKNKKPISELRERSYIGTYEEVVQKLGKVRDLGIELSIVGLSSPNQALDKREILETFQDEIGSRIK